MRKSILLITLLAPFFPAHAQEATSDDKLLAETRDLYDAPFTRNLISFDCAIQFDWNNHFREAFGSVPPTAVPTIDRLQTIPHRVFVDRTGGFVSVIPKAPDLSAIPHGGDLEQALNSMVSGGINAWIPFATNVILPIKPTKFVFQKSDDGYKVTMTGNGVHATLLLNSDFRLTQARSLLPQPLRFSTRFINGPNGYLLESVATGDPTTAEGTGDNRFSYEFQAVQGIELPAKISVKPANSELWHFALTDCKVNTGITIKLNPPPTVH
jgi:hypothetical protein